MTHKTIAVFGATGAQGGGLARAILAEPEAGFALRAVTRKPRGAAAQALRDAGAEVIEADIDDPGSVRKAMEGCWGAYCVTNFWEHFSPERELAQASTLAQAAADAGLGHVVWSTLEDTRRFVPVGSGRMPVLMGRYNVPHLDAKGEADAFFRASRVPTTFLLTSFYWDNLIHLGMAPTRGADGRLKFVLPMGERKLPGIAAEDIGRCAWGIFKQGPTVADRTVGVSGEHLTGVQMAAALAEALGQPVDHVALSFDEYRHLGFPGADDLASMFQFKHDFEESFCAARSVETSRALNPKLQDFAGWLDRNRHRLGVPVTASTP